MTTRDESNDEINPDSWTQKELVKHIYRETKAIRGEQAEIKGSLSILEKDLEKRVILMEDMEKRGKVRDADIKTKATIIGLVMGFVGSILSIALKFLKEHI